MIHGFLKNFQNETRSTSLHNIFNIHAERAKEGAQCFPLTDKK